MLRWFKKHFIPHHDNNHCPHFLRGENTQKIILLVLFFELMYLFLPTLTLVSNYNLAAVFPSVVSTLTNEERINNNLSELVMNPILAEAARLKAEDMLTKGYFAHTSPEGKTPWYWLEQVGYKYDYAGENLAVNFGDSKDVTNAWMNSPTHKANIVKDAYKEIGTGISSGIYEGKETIFVVQIYANPVRKQEFIVSEKLKQEELNTNKVSTITTSDNEPSFVGNVLGATVEENITVETEDESSTAVVNNENEVRKEEVVEEVSSTRANLLEKAVASPRHSSNTIFFVILGIVSVALILNIVIKFNIQHKQLITNGLFILAILIAVLLINNNFYKKNIEISQSIDYSVNDTIPKKDN